MMDGFCQRDRGGNPGSPKVFFSELLPARCPRLYGAIVEVLETNGVAWGLLEGTRDIWCRDYMPVQAADGRYVAFVYNPDYLQDRYYRRTITDWSAVRAVGLPPSEGVVRMELVVDGGNVVPCGDRVVMTDKVLAENRERKGSEVVGLLEGAFGREVLLLPWDRSERLGHSDGIVHYAGNGRVLLTNYNDFSPYFYRRFRRALEDAFEVIPLHFRVRRVHRRSWAYINFLRVGSLVMVPQLGTDEDEQALLQIAAALPDCRVVGVPAIEAVRRGGALNCISWVADGVQVP